MTTYDVSGIDATGSTDVTVALLAFIAACANGAQGSPNTIRFPASAQYRVDGPLMIQGRSHLIFDGQGSTFTTPSPGARTDAHWRLWQCADIRITGVNIVGPNPNAGLGDLAYVADFEAQHGFDIVSSSAVTIDHCSVANIYGDWVYLGLLTEGAPLSTSILIENNNFISNGRQGFGLVACNGVEIRYNTTVECRRSLIDFEPNGIEDGCHNVSIHHNTFGRQRLSFIASKGKASPVDDINVSDNTCITPLASEIAPTQYGLRNRWTVARNVAQLYHGTPARATMKFSRIDGLTVTGNTQPMQAGRDMYLCRLADCTSYDVSGNTIANGTGQFYLANSPTRPHPGRRGVSVVGIIAR